MTQRLTVAGIGPGSISQMTKAVFDALREADVIIGYQVYIDLIKDTFPAKEFLTTPMRREEERCQIALEQAASGKNTVFVCSGDSGVYGMAGLLYEMAPQYPCVDIRVLPGITAALSGGAVLGAPLVHDFSVISLSDLLTPWEKIAARLRCAAQGDFCMALYNPSSHRRHDYLQRACDILLQILPEDRPCGYVMNIGRNGECAYVCTLGELRERNVDMFTTVFIGNSATRIINGKLVTPRGYPYENKAEV